jgi:hypothetical protein
MLEIRFDKTKDEVALLIWFLVDHSVLPAKLWSRNALKLWSRNALIMRHFV